MLMIVSRRKSCINFSDMLTFVEIIIKNGSMKVYRFILASALMAGMLANASAQPPLRPGPGGRPPKEMKQISPEGIAARRTDEMDKIVQLTEKQYKKIYRLYLYAEQERQQMLASGLMGGFPPGRFPSGDGMMGPPPVIAFTSEENIAKREKKIRKILSDEQYMKWVNAAPDPFAVPFAD